jgi:hypothetical protein
MRDGEAPCMFCGRRSRRTFGDPDPFPACAFCIADLRDWMERFDPRSYVKRIQPDHMLSYACYLSAVATVTP